MQDGIYHVRFSASLGGAGEGIVVVKQGAVNGGDAGYLYIGNLTDNGSGVTGQLQVSRWNPGHVSVFGPLDKFDLQLSGQSSQGGFTVQGGTPSMPGGTIKIVGRFLAAAA